MEMTVLDPQTFRLADLLANLSEELREAQQRAVDDRKEGVFRLKGCTVELGVTWERNAEGAVDFWVGKPGGGASRSETESIIISLEPAGERDPVVGIE